MSIKDLEAVMTKEPALNSIGFGLSNLRRYTAEERNAELAKQREELLLEVNAFEKVCEWLEKHGETRTTINRTMNSYGWKHIVEKEIGVYVSNGVFIAAAIHSGFEYKIAAPDSPNAYFNLREHKPAKAHSLV